MSRFMRGLDVDADCNLEVEFEDSTGEAERVILWVDGRGYDVTNASEIADRHGNTIWENAHVREIRRHPKPVGNPVVIEGHD